MYSSSSIGNDNIDNSNVISFFTLRSCLFCKLVGRHNIEVNGETILSSKGSLTRYRCLLGHKLKVTDLPKCSVYSISRLSLRKDNNDNNITE